MMLACGINTAGKCRPEACIRATASVIGSAVIRGGYLSSAANVLQKAGSKAGLRTVRERVRQQNVTVMVKTTISPAPGAMRTALALIRSMAHNAQPVADAANPLPAVTALLEPGC